MSGIIADKRKRSPLNFSLSCGLQWTGFDKLKCVGHGKKRIARRLLAML